MLGARQKHPASEHTTLDATKRARVTCDDDHRVRVLGMTTSRSDAGLMVRGDQYDARGTRYDGHRKPPCRQVETLGPGGRGKLSRLVRAPLSAQRINPPDPRAPRDAERLRAGEAGVGGGGGPRVLACARACVAGCA